jgi:hypothetical protein
METAESGALISPTWLRYDIGIEPTLSPESIAIIDGVISYLCRVVEQGAPKARWRVGYRLVATPSWNTAQLQEWVTQYLEDKVSD